ncbi:hypothetical protein CLD22_26295 [Rubrivivax gelatinosus]|nr:hypothetical protein [Rubrivivax gelatinosus]
MCDLLRVASLLGLVAPSLFLVLDELQRALAFGVAPCGLDALGALGVALGDERRAPVAHADHHAGQHGQHGDDQRQVLFHRGTP